MGERSKRGISDIGCHVHGRKDSFAFLLWKRRKEKMKKKNSIMMMKRRSAEIGEREMRSGDGDTRSFACVHYIHFLRVVLISFHLTSPHLTGPGDPRFYVRVLIDCSSKDRRRAKKDGELGVASCHRSYEGRYRRSCPVPSDDIDFSHSSLYFDCSFTFSSLSYRDLWIRTRFSVFMSGTSQCDLSAKLSRTNWNTPLWPLMISRSPQTTTYSLKTGSRVIPCRTS